MTPSTRAGGSRRALLVGGLLALLASASPLAVAEAPRVSIVSPQPGETVHDNRGRVVVRVSVEPPPSSGQQLRLMVDDQERAMSGLQVEFDGLHRGEHRLQAELVDRDGRVVAASAPVSFFMWQASRLFPNRR